jgi:hypothetical protein
MLKPATKTNLVAMRGVYVSQGHLTEADFDTLVNGTEKINSLDLGGFVWHVPYLARDVHGDISWAVHLQAWAAALQLPYSGIEDFYKRAIQAGALPGWMLNQTTFHEQAASFGKLALGRLLVRLGLVSVIDLERALGIQALIKEETGLPTRIGRILSQLTPISLPDYTRAISIHLGVPYVNLEQTMPVIERTVARAK